MFGPSISKFQCLLTICGELVTTLLNTKLLLNATKQLVFLFVPKSMNNLLHRMFFLYGVRVQFSDQVKYLGASLNASLKDDDDIQRQVKS